jgi:hypothetical protein
MTYATIVFSERYIRVSVQISVLPTCNLYAFLY